MPTYLKSGEIWIRTKEFSCGRGVPPRSGSRQDAAPTRKSRSKSEKKLDILAQLAAEGFCDVDLVFLPKDNIVLRYEAIRMNHVVYQRPDFDRGSTYSLVVRQYLDFLPFLEVQRKALKERLLNDKA